MRRRRLCSLRSIQSDINLGANSGKLLGREPLSFFLLQFDPYFKNPSGVVVPGVLLVGLAPLC